MKYQNVQLYFADCVKREGLRIASGLLEELSVRNGHVYWNENTVDLIIISSSRFQRDNATVERLLSFTEYGVIIEPPLNLVCGEKLALALPFHPKTSCYFPDEVRSLFPQTTLIEPDAYLTRDGDRIYLNEDFCKLGRSKRRYVIKYAGPDIKRISGARGVFNLSHFNSKQVSGIIGNAIQDYHRGHPWILQPVVRAQYPIRYWNEPTNEIVTEEMYIRLTPFYLRRNNGVVSLLGGAVNTSGYWKVSGREDSVLLPIQIKK